MPHYEATCENGKWTTKNTDYDPEHADEYEDDDTVYGLRGGDRDGDSSGTSTWVYVLIGIVVVLVLAGLGYFIYWMWFMDSDKPLKKMFKGSGDLSEQDSAIFLREFNQQYRKLKPSKSTKKKCKKFFREAKKIADRTNNQIIQERVEIAHGLTELLIQKSKDSSSKQQKKDKKNGVAAFERERAVARERAVLMKRLVALYDTRDYANLIHDGADASKKPSKGSSKKSSKRSSKRSRRDYDDDYDYDSDYDHRD